MGQSVEELRLPACNRFTYQGLLSTITPGANATGTTTPGDAGIVGVVGVMHVPYGMCLADHRLIRVVPGSGAGGAAPSTTIQVHRVRSGAWQELATLSVRSAVAFDTSTTNVQGSIGVEANPLATLLKGDLIVVRLVSIEEGAPGNLVVSVETR